MASTNPTPGSGPIPVTELALLGYTNELLDDLFRDSPAGPIPDGDLTGTVLAWPGTRIAKPLATLLYAVAWQGKVVDRRRGFLKNKVSPLHLRAVKAKVSLDASWVDDRECVLLDYSRTSLVARMVRDEIRLVGTDLYLGVIWLGRRRIGWFTLREPSSRAAAQGSDGSPDTAAA